MPKTNRTSSYSSKSIPWIIFNWMQLEMISYHITKNARYACAKNGEFGKMILPNLFQCMMMHNETNHNKTWCTFYGIHLLNCSDGCNGTSYILPIGPQMYSAILRSCSATPMINCNPFHLVAQGSSAFSGPYIYIYIHSWQKRLLHPGMMCLFVIIYISSVPEV